MKKKSLAPLSIGLLAASLAIPMGRAYADLDPPGNKRERQELREDMQQLDRLTMQRNRELRQGDFREAVNTMRRSATRGEKFAETGESYIEIMMADGILNDGIAFMNPTKFLT